MILNITRKARTFIQNSWIAIALVAVLVLAYAAASPAWAAPSPSNQYQTVPRPTATPSGDPVATATPRPDDDKKDSGSSSSGRDNATDSGGSAPVFYIGPDDSSSAMAVGLTATVNVATLNVREGAGTQFPVVGTLAIGDVVNVLARNEANTWWYVCCIPGTNDGGWISAQLLTPNFDRATSADRIPVFGSAPEPVAAEQPEAVTASAASASADSDKKLPIVMSMSLLPPYLQQGDQGKIIIEVSNPNLVDASSVELSDQLPVELSLLDVSVDGQAQVSEQTSTDGAPLVLVRWATVPAGESVQATLVVQIAADVIDGYVFDNLAGARGGNTTYTSSAVTIGMPPTLLPDFQ